MKLHELEQATGAQDALKRLNECITAVRDFGKRGEAINAETLEKLAKESESVSKRLTDAETLLKQNLRTIDTPEIRFAEWLQPEDARTNRTYYNLVALTPAELRYGIQLPGAPAIKRGTEFTDDALIREFQLVNDQLIVADMVLAASSPEYRNLSPDPGTRMQTLKLWKRWEKLYGHFQRAITTGADPGLKWIPTMQSARMVDLIQPTLKVASLFTQVDMPTKAYDLPVLGADLIAVFMGENSQIIAKDPTLNKATLTAIKLAVRNIVSTESTEDSAVALEPFVTGNCAKAISRAIEDDLNNGDVNVNVSTAQDFDMKAAQTPTDGNNHRRKAWDGLRKKALISGMPNQDLTTFSTANLLTLKGAMGVYGAPEQGAWIVGFKGLAKLMGLGELLTLDKLGPQATILTGQVAQYLGSPVILSEFVREDVDSTGVNASSGNTFSTLLYVNREAFVMGRRRDISIVRAAEIQADSDVIQFIGTWRGTFQELFPTGSAANKTVGVGRNF